MNNQKHQIARILVDNVSYSPQIQGIAVGEAIHLLAEREDKAENRGYRRGATTMLIIIASVGTVVGLGTFLSYRASNATPPADYLPPAPGIVIDTAAEIRDSHANTSVALDKWYDSVENAAKMNNNWDWEADTIIKYPFKREN